MNNWEDIERQNERELERQQRQEIAARGKLDEQPAKKNWRYICWVCETNPVPDFGQVCRPCFYADEGDPKDWIKKEFFPD